MLENNWLMRHLGSLITQLKIVFSPLPLDPSIAHQPVALASDSHDGVRVARLAPAGPPRSVRGPSCPAASCPAACGPLAAAPAPWPPAARCAASGAGRRGPGLRTAGAASGGPGRAASGSAHAGLRGIRATSAPSARSGRGRSGCGPLGSPEGPRRSADAGHRAP